MQTPVTKSVGVNGGAGKLGRQLVEAIEDSYDLSLGALRTRVDAPDVLAGSDVILEVSSADGARETLSWAAANGVDVVCGATGLTNEEIAGFDSLFRGSSARCFLVPNFSVGAVLLMQFAERAAKYFDDVEIVETHHSQKKDAPSGTARLTAQRIARARRVSTPSRNDESSAYGELVEGVPVHSIRLAGAVAHEEVIFGGTGQLLTIRHDSLSRESFVDGALLALRSIDKLAPGVTVGLDAVLDL